MVTNEQIKEQLADDIDWLYDEGYHNFANRLERALQYIDQLEYMTEED